MSSSPKRVTAFPGLPAASSAVTVVRVGEGVRPTYAGQSETAGGEELHFVSVRAGLVLQGTIPELREFVAELGMAIAEVELDYLRLQVQEGRRRAAELERRLA